MQYHSGITKTTKHRETESRDALVVFDMNGVLVHYEKYGDRRFHGPQGSVGTVKGRRVWLRPHMEMFVRRLLERGCSVALWSTARQDVLCELVRTALPPDVRDALTFVWDRRWCTHASGNELLKDLSTVWKSPALHGRFDASNTLLVDDSPRKTRLNSPHTVYHMPSFDPRNPARDVELCVGGDLWRSIERMRAPPADDAPSASSFASAGTLRS